MAHKILGAMFQNLEARAIWLLRSVHPWIEICSFAMVCSKIT